MLNGRAGELFPGCLLPPSGLSGYCMHMVQINSYRHTPMHINIINKESKLLKNAENQDKVLDCEDITWHIIFLYVLAIISTLINSK